MTYQMYTTNLLWEIFDHKHKSSIKIILWLGEMKEETRERMQG